MKIVVLGSCRYEPYDVLIVPRKLHEDNEVGYDMAKRTFYPNIELCDEVWVYAPDGVGEHTQRDLDYARKHGKKVRFIIDEDVLELVRSEL